MKQAWGLQMGAPQSLVASDNEGDIVPLGDDDGAEMLALATLTQPGPLPTRTHRMGRFAGIRIDGRLSAMAGERFRFPGWTEVSGVCTHPDFRSRGLARRLSRHVAAGIAVCGDSAFLHAWRDNVSAIRLYESLGFEWRSDVHVVMLGRPRRQFKVSPSPA